MGLEQLNFDGLNKVEVAINILREHATIKPYHLAFSGGACSIVTYDIVVKSGVPFHPHYYVSPIDPPQIYKFIREYYPDVQWDYHARGWWKTVVKRGLPMRQSRWCCELIKEAGGSGETVVLGTRRAESPKRKNMPYYSESREKGKFFIRPILNFDDYDLWQYIKENKLPYCELYDKGFKRLGCILCPFSNKIALEMEYFPKTVALWRKACDRIVDRWETDGTQGKHIGKTGQELFDWWTKRS